ncbi:MAG: SulP family inorganic anion transporter [Rhodospirillaceae bacterium]|nr:SulP family inorganic anion transporter [Rhodospirillaceae bacterium]
MNLIHGLRFNNIRGDITGGLTAAVVALPLALAFGVASGAGPMAGLWGAILVGFFAAVFGGTGAQISGPTGPMTVVMAVIVTRYAHEPAMAFTVVMMGGLLQIAFGAFRLGNYIRLVPFTVISGFMSGIGCIIIILQIAPLLGQVAPGGGTVGTLMALPDIVRGLDVQATGIGLGALAIVYLTPKSINALIPAPLIALMVGTAVAATVFPGVPVLGDIPTGLPDPQLPTFSLVALPDMLGSALILALLGSIDSLLTSLIADSVTNTHHNSDRELIGQGIGNVIAGLFGAIPGAGATMRTVVNVRAGGTTPISGVLHALVLLAMVLGAGSIATHIPHAVLAGILFKVGFDIIDWAYLRRASGAPRAGVVLMLLVLGLTVFVDLIMAVTVGVIAASLLFVKRMSDLQLNSIRASDGSLGEIPMTAEEEAALAAIEDAVLLYHFSGPVSFGAAKGLAHRVAPGDHHKVLILDMADVTYLDTSAALALEDIIVKAGKQGLRVYVAGLREPVEKMLRRFGVLDSLNEGRCYASRLDALHGAAHAIVDDPKAERQ